MKLRHAAALALVGWYLLISPTTDQNQADLEAPLSKWQNAGSFDSASDCEAIRRRVTKDLWSEKDQLEWRFRLKDIKRSGHSPVSYSEYAKRLQGAQCVSSDDPRLKEN
ncbi:MAG: hypothetical protein ACLQU2_02055 [Candidatus Binataceae bacterium]